MAALLIRAGTTIKADKDVEVYNFQTAGTLLVSEKFQLL
jgi:hypothetical protein